MQGLKEGFIPLEQANTDRFSVNIKFPPHVPLNGLGINVGRIHRLCEIGGLNRLSLVDKVDEPASGLQADLSADGTEDILERRMSLYTLSGKVSRNENQPIQSAWADVELEINLREMNQRMSQDPRFNVGTIQPWVYYLDKIIRGGITDASLGQLSTFSVGKAVSFSAVVLAIAGTYKLMSQQLPPFTVTDLVVGMTAGGFITEVYKNFHWERFRKSRIPGNRGYRISAISYLGPQFDRMMLVKALTATQPLVKALPLDKHNTTHH